MSTEAGWLSAGKADVVAGEQRQGQDLCPDGDEHEVFPEDVRAAYTAGFTDPATVHASAGLP